MLRSYPVDNLANDFLPLLNISKEKAERNVAEAENYLRLDLKNIAEILSAYHPLELVKMSVWEERRIDRSQKNGDVLRAYRLLPVLLQSVLSSGMYERRSSSRDVREKDWSRLVNLGQDFSRKLSRMLDNRAALEYLKGNTDRNGASDYRNALYRQFFPERKDERKLADEKLLASTSLEDNEEVVRSFFGMDVGSFISGLSSIALESLGGIDRLSRESAAFKSEVLLRMAKLKAEEGNGDLDDEQLRMKVYKDVSVYQQALKLEGQRDGFDLFRPEFCSELSEKALDKLSVGTGELDFDKYFFAKGLWISTVFPFLKVGDMYFSFVGKYILSCAQRVASETLNLHSRITAATYLALSSLFTATDVVGVYSFDGNKIDISVLESLVDINAFANPQQWFMRRLGRIEDERVRPQLGHKLIFVDPDGDEKLLKIDENTYSTSVIELLNVRNNNTRTEFFTTILGEYKDVEPSPYSDVFESDELANEEVRSDDDVDLPESELEDMDESDYVQDDEPVVEDEGTVDPLTVSASCPISEDERTRYLETYEDNLDIIEEELGKSVDNTQYDGVDDDEYIDDDDLQDSDDYEDVLALDVDEEVESEEDEAAEVSEDDEDPDQLDFMDLLDEDEAPSERIEPDFTFAIPPSDGTASDDAGKEGTSDGSGFSMIDPSADFYPVVSDDPAEDDSVTAGFQMSDMDDEDKPSDYVVSEEDVQSQEPETVISGMSQPEDDDAGEEIPDEEIPEEEIPEEEIPEEEIPEEEIPEEEIPEEETPEEETPEEETLEDETLEDETPEEEIPEEEIPEEEVPEDEVPEDEVPEDEVPEDEVMKFLRMKFLRMKFLRMKFLRMKFLRMKFLRMKLRVLLFRMRKKLGWTMSRKE